MSNTTYISAMQGPTPLSSAIPFCIGSAVALVLLCYFIRGVILHCQSGVGSRFRRGDTGAPRRPCRGVSKLRLQQLLQLIFQDEKSLHAVLGDGKADEASTCPICLQTYNVGDSLRILPCRHCFHSSCVDQWLTTCCSCPLCRGSVCVEADDGSPTRDSAAATSPGAAVSEVEELQENQTVVAVASEPVVNVNPVVVHVAHGDVSQVYTREQTRDAPVIIEVPPINFANEEETELACPYASVEPVSPRNIAARSSDAAAVPVQDHDVTCCV